MKNELIFTVLGIAAFANLSIAQNSGTSALPIPEGYKVVSSNISGNGQTAIVGIQKDAELKYLSFKKQNGTFGAASENNPLNQLIGEGVIPLNPSQSNDGSEIYFAANNNGNTDIFVITKKKGQWSNHVSLGDSINSPENEQYPAISPDGNTIYFTRLSTKAIDKRCGVIFTSHRNPGGVWNKAVDVPEPVTLGCDAAPYVCPDNKTIYFSSIREGQGKGGFDIYYTQRVDDKMWIIPIPMDTVNLQGDDFSPTFDYESKKMYLVQQDVKKKSNYNLYSANLPGNFMHQPVARFYGKVLDKANNRPMASSITVTDVFSSNVLSIFKTDDITGDYDFFLNGYNGMFLDYTSPNYSHYIEEITPDGKEHKQNNTIFPKVELTLNVFDSDMYEALSSDISITADGKKQNIKIEEFAKGRYKMDLPIGKNYTLKVTKDRYDDFEFDFNLNQVVIFDSFERDAELKSNKSRIIVKVRGLEPGATTDVTISNLSTATRFSTTLTTDANGQCELLARKGDTYSIDIMKKGYTMFNQEVKIEQNGGKDDYEVIAEIAKLQENVKITIPNINFETNSSVLDPSSYENLNKVVSLLKLNPDIKIELSAHTDDKGTDAYNMKLSQQRAASVVSFITNKGIDKTRIVSKGYGESQPLVPNTDDNNRALNRRVELKILGTVSNQ